MTATRRDDTEGRVPTPTGTCWERAAHCCFLQSHTQHLGSVELSKRASETLFEAGFACKLEPAPGRNLLIHLLPQLKMDNTADGRLGYVTPRTKGWVDAARKRRRRSPLETEGEYLFDSVGFSEQSQT